MNIFGQISLSHTGIEPRLASLIELLKWGSHRDIRQRGFRILPCGEELRHIKSIPICNDPNQMLKPGDIVLQLDGKCVREIVA